MNVNVYGFEWYMGDGITLNNFCTYLTGISGVEKSNRMIAVCEKNGYWVGVFLTIKDMKAFCKIQKEGGRFVIKPQELEKGTSMTDFNFFIIHPVSGRGLYQHYHQSASTNKFCSVCRDYYSSLKDLMIKKEIEKAGKISKAQRHAIEAKYYGLLESKILVRPESFEDCVEALSQIKSFKFEFITLTAQEKAMSAISKYASRMTHIVNFNKKDDQNSIAKAIGKMLKIDGQNMKKGVVKGIDGYGNEATYKLFNDYASFDQFKFDEIIQTIKIDSTDLVQTIKDSYIVNELLSLANKPNIKQILSVPVKK